MNHIKLKSLINEHNGNQLYESFNKDLEYLQEKLIEEGLWDAIKQKAGGVIDKTSNKAKELLLKPLLKVIVDKIKKDDPDGFAKLQQAAQDPQKIEKLVNHPTIQKQKSKVEKELQSTKEGLTEQEEDDFLQEYFDAVLEEARVLRDDPRNVARRQRYAKRKAARLSGQNQPTKKQEPVQEPSAGDNIKQGAKQLGKGLAQGADKLGVAAIEKGGDALKAVGKGVGSAMDTKAGQAVKGAVGGLVSKVYGWAKSHPKITAAAGIGLMVAVLGAAAVGSGGIAPLIGTTLVAAGGGAVKGGAIGGVVGAGKEMYSQIKGGAKSFKDMDYKKVGKAALKAGGKGAAIGAAVGAGANILGKAALGAKDIASGEYGKAMKGLGQDNPLRDLTPGEKRNLGVKDGFMDKQGQYQRHSAGPESIKQNYFKVGGEIVNPGQPLTKNQLDAMKMAIDMGNDGNKLYGPELMKQYDAWQHGGGSELINAKASAASLPADGTISPNGRMQFNKDYGWMQKGTTPEDLQASGYKFMGMDPETGKGTWKRIYQWGTSGSR